MLMDLVDSGIFRIRTVILELEHLNHLERIITDSWALLPEFLIQEFWGGARELAFLSSQVMLMTLAQELHLEKHCNRSL